MGRLNPKVSVRDISVHDDNEVRYELSYSRRLERFLNGVDPYIRYSEDVSEVPRSVLAVPLLAMLCPVVWLTGADVYIDEIDETFRDSLPALKNAYAELYPDAPFDREVSVYYKEAVNNDFSDARSENGETGVLFTGGVDSTTTYLRHREERPHLISVRKEGETRDNTWGKRTRMIDAFAAESGLESHFIETNLKSAFDKFTLNLYHRHQLNDSWDRTMFFGIGYPGFTAPLAYDHGITNVYQSSDYLPHDRFPNSAQPTLVENLRWSDTVVESDGIGMTRQDGIEYIGEHFEGQDTVWEISSCDEGGESSLSCNRCSTCLHTITGFIVANYDPAEFGFDMDGKTFDRIEAHLNEQEFGPDSVKARFWLELQNRADPEKVDLSYEGAIEFVEWFADATITEALGRPLPVHEPDYEASLKRRLCTKLPYPIDMYVIRYYFDHLGNG